MSPELRDKLLAIASYLADDCDSYIDAQCVRKAVRLLDQLGDVENDRDSMRVALAHCRDRQNRMGRLLHNALEMLRDMYVAESEPWVPL